ncbi:TPA: diacylglycerol kinase family lipid kinase [Candidatus Poribacteria bacterium]|nr:diacylglycerol kinase family lipid kinase [Candidatus Poribacteria bacterium]
MYEISLFAQNDVLKNSIIICLNSYLVLNNLDIDFPIFRSYNFGKQNLLNFGLYCEKTDNFWLFNSLKDKTLNIKFIVNPSAGHGNYKHVIHDIESVFSRSHFSYDITILSCKGEATLIAKESADNYSAIIAVGGDGTINEVLNGLIGTNAILGIIPAGTGNGIAREFGLPLKVKEACKIILNGHTKWIDVGNAGGRYFMGCAGTGFDALIAKFAGELRGPFRGIWVYFFAGLIVFHRYKPKLVNITINSELSLEVKPLLIAIANTKRYGGRALITPQASPDDGLFDICIIKSMNMISLAFNLPKLFKGTHTNLPQVKIHKAENVFIQANEPIPFHIDGESLDSCCSIQFNIMPKAIRLFVPKEG